MRDDVVCADQAEGGLVCVVEPLATHLAVQLGNLVHGPLVLAVRSFALQRGNRDRACCAAWSWSGARETRHAVFRWVTRYNTRRRHSSIGQISPIAYAQRSNTLCPMSKAAMPGLQH